MKRYFHIILLLIVLSSMQNIHARLLLRSSKQFVALITSCSTCPGIIAFLADKTITQSLTLGIVGILFGGWGAYRTRPERRLGRAYEKLTWTTETTEYQIASQHHDQPEQMIEAINHCYIDDEFPLVSGFEKFVNMRKDIIAASKLIDSAKQQCSKKYISGDQSTLLEGLLAQAQEYSLQLLAIQKNVEHAMLTIKNDPLWLKRVKSKYNKDAAKAARSNAIANWANAGANAGKIR